MFPLRDNYFERILELEGFFLKSSDSFRPRKALLAAHWFAEKI